LLAEREVLELSERAMGHLALIEKYRTYARQTPDNQVRDILNRHQQVLQQHYQMMMGFLQNAQGVGGPGTIAPQQWSNLTYS